MAKMNKIMPPRNTTIRGQDHLLAYITPEEAQMLMANGGAGKAGPMGIPAFYDEGDDYSGPGGDDSSNDFGLSDDFGNDYSDGGDPNAQANAVSAAKNALDRSLAVERAQKAAAGQAMVNTARNPIANSAMTAADFAFSPISYDLTSQAINNLGVARGGLRSLAGLTRAQYGAMPSYMRDVYDKTGAYNFEFGPKGRVTGFYGPPGGSPFPGLNMLGTGIVGLTDMLLGPPMTEDDLAMRSVYTGFGEGSRSDGGRDEGSGPEIKPANPETGECDEGYVPDPSMAGFCRLDTGYVPPGQVGAGQFGQPGERYARMGLLDVAPTGLPQFQQQYGTGFGSPADFAAANAAFRYGGAYEPSMFKNPYPTTGMEQVKRLS